MNNSIVWLIILIITLIIEGISCGLVSIWFSIGAIAAFITSYIIDSFIIQTTVFVLISLISLIITRPFAKKYLIKKKIKTNCDSLIGKIGVVKEDITKDKMGVVKVEHQMWSAESVDKEIIQKENEVAVLSISGVKLIVRKKD